MTSSAGTRGRLAVAVIGTGNVGATIARDAADGWNVVAAADLVVASIPFGAHRSLPARELVGKVVLDAVDHDTGPAQALRLLDAVGFEGSPAGSHVGSPADSWRQEPGSPVPVAPCSQDDPTVIDPWECSSTAGSVHRRGETEPVTRWRARSTPTRRRRRPRP